MMEDIQFFSDTTPCYAHSHDGPIYTVDRDFVTETEEEGKVKKSNSSCWNCGKDGHSLRDCKEARNLKNINKNRQAFMNKSVEYKRYHDEADQKYAHLKPGMISDNLRKALGLNDNQLPRHIYMMRSLGYPPGWVLEAEISATSLEMYDAQGERIPEPDDEEGEIKCKKPKYDFNKIWDYPGFNVEPSHKYKQEEHIYNAPPLSKHQSKMTLINYLKNTESSVVTETVSKKVVVEDNVDVEINDMEVEEIPGIDLLPPDDCKFIPPLPEEAPPPPPLCDPEEMVEESNSSSAYEGATSTPRREVTSSNDDSNPSTPFTPSNSFSNLGKVKSLYMGTPVLKSRYKELPSPASFAQDMSEVEFFDNLPTALGTYDKMRGVLAKTREKLASNSPKTPT